MKKDLSKIRLIIVDVDGTMTDGGLYYDSNGNEIKKFCSKDAAGFWAAENVGIKMMVLTGRESPMVSRRLTELKTDYLIQGIKDKKSWLKQFLSDHDYKKYSIAYIGDDVNDIGPMGYAGFIGCPADSCKEILDMADYISPIKGGYGAARDVIEHILRERGQWDSAIHNVYHI